MHFNNLNKSIEKKYMVSKKILKEEMDANRAKKNSKSKLLESVDRRLNERNWKFTIPGNYRNAVFDAGDEEDFEGVRLALMDICQYVVDHVSESEEFDGEELELIIDEYNDLLEELEYQDFEDEDECNYWLNELYDLMDNTDIFLGLREGLKESKLIEAVSFSDVAEHQIANGHYKAYKKGIKPKNKDWQEAYNSFLSQYNSKDFQMPKAKNEFEQYLFQGLAQAIKIWNDKTDENPSKDELIKAINSYMKKVGGDHDESDNKEKEEDSANNFQPKVVRYEKDGKTPSVKYPSGDWLVFVKSNTVLGHKDGSSDFTKSRYGSDADTHEIRKDAFKGILLGPNFTGKEEYNFKRTSENIKEDYYKAAKSVIKDHPELLGKKEKDDDDFDDFDECLKESFIDSEFLNGDKVKYFNDYLEAKKYADKLGLKESEYGDAYGCSYCCWNETGDKNDTEMVVAYYDFQNGKPVKLSPKSAESIKKNIDIDFTESLNESTDEVVVGLYGDEVNGIRSVSGLVQYFESKGLKVSNVSGDMDYGWELNVTGNPRTIFLAVQNLNIPGYMSDSIDDFISEYRIDALEESLWTDLVKKAPELEEKLVESSNRPKSWVLFFDKDDYHSAGSEHSHSFNVSPVEAEKRIKSSDYHLPKDAKSYIILTDNQFQTISYDDLYKYHQKYGKSLNEDTKKIADGKWVNKGKEGTHGEFKTKKEADAQRKAMFANGYKESLTEATGKHGEYISTEGASLINKVYGCNDSVAYAAANYLYKSGVDITDRKALQKAHDDYDTWVRSGKADKAIDYFAKLIKKGKIPRLNESLTEGWRGCKDIEMVSHGAWADPDLIYDGYTFNYWDIEDALWDMFLDETGHTDSESDNPEVEEEFNLFVQDRAPQYLEDVIYGGYFNEGSTSWHDNY